MGLVVGLALENSLNMCLLYHIFMTVSLLIKKKKYDGNNDWEPLIDTLDLIDTWDKQND